MTDIEYEFDNLLDDATSGRRSPADCVALCREKYPELVPSLELALALRNTTLNQSETDAARTRVRSRLDALLAQDEEPTAPGVTVRVRVHQRRKRMWLVVAACAAVLLVTLMGVWTLSTVAAGALPGSPLYSVKRADENIQLWLAWSDSAHAETLSMIAMHRLDEARAEAARQNTGQALELMKECDTATRQLIGLVVTTRDQHENDDAVAHALARTLQAEYDALQQAQNNGQSVLAQALIATVTDQQSELNASNIQIPSLTPPIPAPPVATHPTSASPPTPDAHTTPSPKPKTSPTPNGKGNGVGNNGNNGNGNGNSGNNGNNSGAHGSGHANVSGGKGASSDSAGNGTANSGGNGLGSQQDNGKGKGS